MPSQEFKDTFAKLRGVLKPLEKELVVQSDDPINYTLCLRDATDRVGRPLYFGGVRMGKAYVSYHLMPVYARPDLVKEMSPSLKKRMQGKSCFNFTTIEPAHLEELSALTKKGLRGFKDVVAALMATHQTKSKSKKTKRA